MLQKVNSLAELVKSLRSSRAGQVHGSALTVRIGQASELRLTAASFGLDAESEYWMHPTDLCGCVLFARSIHRKVTAEGQLIICPTTSQIAISTTSKHLGRCLQHATTVDCLWQRDANRSLLVSHLVLRISPLNCAPMSINGMSASCHNFEDACRCRCIHVQSNPTTKGPSAMPSILRGFHPLALSMRIRVYHLSKWTHMRLGTRKTRAARWQCRGRFPPFLW